jgi:hypothetical protein
MIKSTMTTLSPTAVILLTIAIIEKWSAGAPPAAAGFSPAACNIKTKRPKAFAPRKLIRIFTLTPPKVF